MPFNISFTRTFKHQPWTDSRDRVTADGENGFNVRFKALEADLDALHDRFVQVSAALNTVAAGGGADRVISVSPVLVTTGDDAWDLSTVGSARKPPANGKALGWVQVPMPPAGVVSSFTVGGRCVGTGAVQVTLYRVDTRGVKSQISTVKVPGKPADAPFTVTQSANGHRIDPTSSYFFEVSAQSDTTTDVIHIYALQIACAAA
ncbi:hypothetical protein ACIA8C_09555 [Nocardia sp. NPDC051321]|uniref:hypothetical protein n=1 Tax=Nocardia sp. NPDC051321 TaxID=3364323 RepID=UPI0037B1167A